MTITRLTVRARLLLALALLAVATLTVGTIAWVALTTSTDRLDRLHGETLAEVDRALTLSRRAADLATLAPYLLTLETPFRIARDGAAAAAIVDAIAEELPPDHPLDPVLDRTRGGIADLVRETSLRAGLRDRALRLNAELARTERRLAALAASHAVSLPERQHWLTLQRLAAALLSAGRAENLIAVGEFHREYVALLARLAAMTPTVGAVDMARLSQIAEGADGLFELRRQELSRRIGAEAALVRIRQGAAMLTRHAAAATAEAQAVIAAERTRTTTAIALAKSIVLTVGFASAGLALLAALFVSRYVTANLRAVSDAMMRLATGDRQTRLPRGAGLGDEIGKLFHAFRVFRANALRLDRNNRRMAQRTALFENMMAGISDGVAILTDQGALVTHNDRLAHVLGLDPARLRGRPILEAVIAQAGWQVARGPADLCTMTSPDGRHAEWRESPLPGGGSVVLVSDSTERRQMEDRLRQIQRIELLGKVSGEVAHDFGNILSTISGSLHLMQSATPDRQVTLRQSMMGAVDLGMSLTQRLLSFARRQQLEPETVDLNAMIDGMADLIGFALHEHVRLDIRTGDRPLPVRVDPGQMESAILNLCLNAGQAIDGSGTITLSADCDGVHAFVKVSDTGCGMAPEVLAHAMEPFFTARRDGLGTGLGLAMVYGFIRQSGGDVHIRSAPGKGTTVQLSLPMQGDDATALPTLGAVLLVEDDPRDMAFAKGILTARAGTLTSCTDAECAMARIDEGPIDLLVTDLSLNGRTDGWRLAAAALERWPTCRALVVSGRLPEANPLRNRFGTRVWTATKPLSDEAMSPPPSRPQPPPPLPADEGPRSDAADGRARGSRVV